MKTILLLFLLFCNIYFVKAQSNWTLEDCIKYALENNIQIKQQALNLKYSENTLRQSKMDYLPSVNGSISRSFDQGLSIDQSTNTYVKNNQTQDYYSLNSSLNLFTGMRTYHTVKKNEYALSASIEDQKKIQNDVMLGIASAYLIILFNQEIVQVNKAQVELTKQQVERTQKLVDAGSVPKGNLLLVQSQLANEELAVINAENSVRTATLNLMQFLDLKDNTDFKIVVPQLPEVNTLDFLPEVKTIFDKALELPQIKSAEYSLLTAESNLKIARSGRSPRLSLGFTYSSGYTLGRDYPMTDIEYPVKDQFNDNARKSLVLSLNIPIFNSWQVETQISNSKISIENSKLQLETSKNTLYKEIQQAYNDVLSAQKSYIGAKKAYDANKEAFMYTQQKFEVGLVTTIEFNEAKNNLAKSESQMLQNKFDYIFKKAILDFYQGNPIKL